MDLKKRENKPQLIKSKNRVIKDLDLLIKGYMESGDENQYKQAANLVYWFKDFKKYTLEKPTFNPNRLIRYSRGQIIKVNFGFNVGNEEGGMHYAIVVDNRNKKSSGTITVIPLTSIKFNDQGKMKKFNEEYAVNLGTEVYDKLRDKFMEHYNEAVKQIAYFEELGKQVFAKVFEKYCVDVEKMLKDEVPTDTIFNSLSTAYNKVATPHKKYKGTVCNEQRNIKHSNIQNDVAVKKKVKAYLSRRDNEFESIMEPLSDASACADRAENSIIIIKKVEIEVEKMKTGSIALVGQITTISKQRIYDPRTMKDVFPGVIISRESMDKIDEKIKKLYIN